MDLELIENDNGGDLVLKGNDLSFIDGFQNMPYIALFGGNVGFSTTERIESQQSFDWWGNSLLMANNPDFQFNSLTENILNIVSLNSNGRIEIENAVKKDLQFMSEFGKVSVNVSIENEKVIIDIKIAELENSENKEFQFIWDATKKEL